jgi:hypothetical protein
VSILRVSSQLCGQAGGWGEDKREPRSLGQGEGSVDAS